MIWYLGYDPVGKGRFAAVALREVGHSVDQVRGSIVSSVSEALAFATDLGGRVVAAAIDAPLTWSTRPGGWRRVDEELRRRHRRHQGKVVAPNSLMGAVAVQGPALAMALAERFTDIVISEAHPKLACVALGVPLDEDPQSRAASVFQAMHMEGALRRCTDDVVDGLVAACTAWAAHAKPSGWADLLRELEDPELLYPVAKERLVYYFPTSRETVGSS